MIGSDCRLAKKGQFATNQHKYGKRSIGNIESYCMRCGLKWTEDSEVVGADEDEERGVPTRWR